MGLFHPIAEALAGEVGLAANVTLLTRHQFVSVRIAARSDHVVHARPVLVPTVGDRVIGDGGQRPNVGHVTP